MRNVYRPMLTNASDSLWGKASSEEKNELMVGVDNFVHNLGENLKSLNSGLELRKPDPYHESLGPAASSDPSTVSHYMEVSKK